LSSFFKNLIQYNVKLKKIANNLQALIRKLSNSTIVAEIVSLIDDLAKRANLNEKEKRKSDL